MFWRKKSAVADSDVALYALAAQLGMEKRFSPRVSYPPVNTAGLPQFTFENSRFDVHDLSVGGCSLLDPGEVFGAQIGLEYSLVIDWGTERDVVVSRLVGRVDRRRNFQFTNLPAARAERIKHLIAPGVRGSSLSIVRDPGLHGPVLDALEVWTSPGGDSVTIESHVQRLASIYFAGKTVAVLRGSWPTDEQGRPISVEDLRHLVLFLANAPQRTTHLNQLLKVLEETSGGPRP